jgi:hypothetical protein
MREIALVMVVVALSGCREAGNATPPPAAALPEGSAIAPAFSRDQATAPALAKAGERAEVVPASVDGDGESAEPTDPADTEGEAATGDGAPTDGAPDAPLPDVTIKNVGMHIGGEDNTAEQKRPVRAAIAAHYDDMRRCYAKATDPAKEVTFGVDIRISGEGGKPKITNPRSGLKGEGVVDCMVAAFEAVDFPRQPGNRPRMVSYSIQFERN